MAKQFKAVRIYETPEFKYEVVAVGIDPIYSTFDGAEAQHYAEYVAETVIVRLQNGERYVIES